MRDEFLKWFWTIGAMLAIIGYALPLSAPKRLNDIELRLDSLELEKKQLEFQRTTLTNENEALWRLLEKQGRPVGDRDLTECP